MMTFQEAIIILGIGFGTMAFLFMLVFASLAAISSENRYLKQVIISHFNLLDARLTRIDKSKSELTRLAIDREAKYQTILIYEFDIVKRQLTTVINSTQDEEKLQLWNEANESAKRAHEDLDIRSKFISMGSEEPLSDGSIATPATLVEPNDE